MNTYDKTSGNGSGLVVLALVVAFVVALGGYNWLVEVVAHAHWGL
jgi:hypothetical protein